MAKYRTDTRDVAPKAKPIAKVTPGELPPSRVPIFDAQGRRRGHVGRKASEAVVARFGIPNAKLGKVDGRDAWVSADRNVVGGFGSAKGPNK